MTRKQIEKLIAFAGITFLAIIIVSGMAHADQILGCVRTYDEATGKTKSSDCRVLSEDEITHEEADSMVIGNGIYGRLYHKSKEGGYVDQSWKVPPDKEECYKNGECEG